jgi:hypothetical protein
VYFLWFAYKENESNRFPKSSSVAEMADVSAICSRDQGSTLSIDKKGILFVLGFNSNV